jgi:CBS domain-containing protein
MKCVDAMKRSVVSVAPDDTIATAAKKMRDADIGFLPVCAPDGEALGVITDRDIAIRVVAEGKVIETKVSEVMSHELVCVSVDSDLSEAEELMAKHQKSRIVCTDDEGRVVGVISLSDLPSFESSRRAGAVFSKVSEREART